MMALADGHTVRSRVTFLGTYVPRRCGIATFTRDLVHGVTQGWHAGTGARLEVVAMLAGGDTLSYPPEVRYRLPMDDRDRHRRLAMMLDLAGTEVLSVQHEYGIYGGPDGSYLFELLDALRPPIITTLHTVLARPSPGQLDVLGRLAARSARIVVMGAQPRTLVLTHVDLDPGRVVVIPHGVPDIPFVDPRLVKPRLGMGARPLVLSFGLLSAVKRLELAIEAVAMVARTMPDVRYAIVGQTHPEVVRREGEAYRARLQRRVVELGLQDNVRFVDEYLDREELQTWLQASDVVVTPYGDAQQVASGTLAAAIAAGRAVVSTPYAHAEELLAEGRGVLTPFDDVAALAAALEMLLRDAATRAQMQRRAYAFARSMLWTTVGRAYGRLFSEVARDAGTRRRRPRGTPTRPAPVPPVRRDHLDELRGPLGLFQHARGTVPDLPHGYCTDDNARALIVELALQRGSGRPVSGALDRYLAFLEDAFEPSTGRSHNFRATNGEWLDQVGSEDSHGRVIWALGEAVLGLPAGEMRRRAQRLFRIALPPALAFEGARPMAYAILGCAAIEEAIRWPVASHALDHLATRSARRLLAAEDGDASGWPWPESVVTYDNGVIPQALLIAGHRRRRRDWIDLALRSLAWLVAHETAPDGHISIVGNAGWWPRGERRASFDQQPIEAASLIEAARTAWMVTGNEAWPEVMERGFAWFLGDNDVGLGVADPDRGGCRDGLGPTEVNRNQGAESTLAWLMAVERVRELRASLDHAAPPAIRCLDGSPDRPRGAPAALPAGRIGAVTRAGASIPPNDLPEGAVRPVPRSTVLF